MKTKQQKKIHPADCLNILKWAAGSERFTPYMAEFDEDQLITLVNLHHLAGRFLQRLNVQTFSWITPRLLNALREIDLQTRVKVVEHAEAVREINSKLHGSTIIVKGIATYALVNQTYARRYGGDIDLLYGEHERLLDVLRELGYYLSKEPFLYELGGFRRGDIEIDVHEYFPVFAYSDVQRNTNLTAKNNPGIWYQNYQLVEYKITPLDLSGYSCHGQAYETKDLTVPDPNMLALIFCAHAFRHYTDIWSISCREKPVMPLAELRDLFDLAVHPAFNSALFLRLVHQFGGEDAVEWVASLATSFFGHNPLPISTSLKLNEELVSTRFPRCLWWNFWMSLASPINGLLDCGIPPMSILIEQLEACEIIPGKVFSTIGTDSSWQLPRQLIQTPDHNPLPLELLVNGTEQEIYIDLHVIAVPSGNVDRVRVDFGHVACEWVHLIDSHQQFLEGNQAITLSFLPFADQETGYRLSFAFPRDVLKSFVQEQKTISLLLGVARQIQGQGIIASTLIPLIISF